MSKQASEGRGAGAVVLAIVSALVLVGLFFWLGRADQKVNLVVRADPAGATVKLVEPRIPGSYQPWDLVSVKRANIAGSGQVRARMIKDLKALAKAARKAGKPLAVRSAWRSYGYQQALFDSYVRRNGRAQALKFSARPGHSEHQLGTTVDFTVGPGAPLSSKFGDTPSGKWLAKNGWKYGFIMSYPKGKKHASCYGYEPWHWRYFGRKLAGKIYDSEQVPRRYLYENFETAP